MRKWKRAKVDSIIAQVLETFPDYFSTISFIFTPPSFLCFSSRYFWSFSKSIRGRLSHRFFYINLERAFDAEESQRSRTSTHPITPFVAWITPSRVTHFVLCRMAQCVRLFTRQALPKSLIFRMVFVLSKCEIYAHCNIVQRVCVCVLYREKRNPSTKDEKRWGEAIDLVKMRLSTISVILSPFSSCVWVCSLLLWMHVCFVFQFSSALAPHTKPVRSEIVFLMYF